MSLYSSGNLITNSYPISQLSANTTYTFNITPTVSNVTEYGQSITITTLAVIGAITVPLQEITENSITVHWDSLPYSYSYVNLQWVDTTLISYYYSQKNNKNNKYITGNLNNLIVTSNVISNLISNHPYYFTITAFNAIGTPTQSIQSDTVVTHATVSQIYSDRNHTDTSYLSLFWKSQSSSYVSLDWQPPNTLGNSNITYITQTSNTVGYLLPNTTYSFTLTPYNTAGIPSKNPSYYTTTTVPTVGDIFINNITDTSLLVNWASGAYSNIRVTAVDLITQSNIIIIPNITTSNIYISPLKSNYPYIFKVKPFNQGNPVFYNYSVYSDIIITLANISTPYTSNITPFSSTIVWDSGEYYSINILYYPINNISTSNTIYNIKSHSYTLSNLYPNTTYQVQAYPNNINNISNYSSNINFTTLPNIPTFSYTQLTSSSVLLDWYSGDSIFNYTDIYYYYPSHSNYISGYYTFIPGYSNYIPGYSNYISPSLSNYISSSSNYIAGYSNYIYDSYSLIPGYSNYIPSFSNTVYNITTSSYLISNLIPNTTYYYTLIPYNDIAIAGSNLYQTISTLGYCNPTLSFITYTYKSYISLIWSGSYSYMNIINYNDFSSIITLPNTINTYTVSNLTPNKLYTFAFNPINLNQLDGQYVFSSNITLSYINNFNVLNISSNSIFISFGKDSLSAFNFANIYYTQYTINTNNTFSITNTYFTSNITSTSYLLTNLLPNKPYNIQIDSYNSNSIYGNSYTNTSFIYTLSDILSFNILSSTYNSFDLSWTNLYKAYNTIDFIYSYKGSNYYAYASSSTNTINISFNIKPNTYYNFKAITYNSAIPTKQGTILNSCNITLPYAGNIIVSSIDTSSINFSWLDIINYNYVNIYWSNVNSFDSGSNIIYKNNNFTINNLITNNNYIINIQPYNLVNITGIISSYNFVTKATVLNVVLTNITQSSVTISWNGGSYSTVGIFWTNNNNTNFGNITNITGNSITISNLLSNTSYIFRVLPYNSVFVTDNSLGTIINCTTLATVGPITISAINNSSLYVSWDTGSYTYINLNWNPNGIPQIYLTSNVIPYLINNLLPNTEYIFYIIPFNSIGAPNNSIYSSPIITLPNIYSVTQTAISPYSFSFQLNAAYSNTTIQWASYSDTTSNYYYTISNGILPNNPYIISFLPYNSIHIPGNMFYYPSISSSVYSLATIGNIININNTTTSITLIWTSDIYLASKYKVTWTTNDTITPINTSSFINNNLYVYTDNITNTYTYTISPLSPYTNYLVKIIPYNNDTLPNNINCLSNVVMTKPLLTNLIVTNIGSRNITIGWSGLYFMVHIYITSDTQSTQQFDIYYPTNTFNFSAAINTSYTFTVIPFNTNIQNTFTQGSALAVSATTLPGIGNLSLTNITTTTATVQWNNINIFANYIILSWQPADIFGNSSSAHLIPPTDNSIVSTSYTINNLLPNLYYTFALTPYNSDDSAGLSTFASGVTHPYIDDNNIIVNVTDVTASHYIPGYYSNLHVSWSNLININSPTYSNIYTSNAFTTTQLVPNGMYKFIYYPYNLSNIVGNSSTRTVVEFSTIGSNTIYNITEISGSVSWITSGYTYDYTIVSWTSPTNNTLYSTPLYQNSGVSNYNITNLTPNNNYSIKVTPYNVFNIPNTLVLPSQLYTLPYIDSSSITSSIITDNYITLNWIGYYSNVTLSWNILNSPTIYSSNIQGTVFGNTTFTITNLLPKNFYIFKFLPYNELSIPGNLITTSTYLTKTVVYSASNISPITPYGTRIAWDSVSDYVIVTQSPATIGAQKINSPIKFTNLTFVPNTLYTISITPWYDDTINRYPGANIYTFIINSLPIVTNINVLSITDYSAIINWDKTNDDYNYIIIQYYTANTSNISPRIYDTTYEITQLLANTDYNLTAIPYNISNTSNNSNLLNTISFTTLPNITSIDETDVAINGANNYITLHFNGSYDYINLSVYPTISVSNPINTSSYTINNLAVNTFYTFTARPYSNKHIPNVYGNDVVTIFSSAASVSGQYAAPYSDNNGTISATISWNSSTSYSSNLISWTSINGNQSLSSSVTGSTIIISNYGSILTPNTQYTFTIIPLNRDNIQGSSVSTSSIYTYASITYSSYTPNITSLVFNWTGGTYSYIVITYNSFTSAHINDITYTINSLSPNTNYTVYLTPYNSVNQNNPTYYQYTQISATTLADIGTVTTVSATTSITVNWSNNKYNYIVISWTPNNGTSNNISSSSSSYTITGLNSYTQYTITITPYNNILVPTIIQPINVTTLVSINSVYISNLTYTNTATISWNGLYAYIIASSSPTSHDSPSPSQPNAITGSSYNFTLLNPNTSYTFNVIPYDSIGTAGITATTNVIARPFLNTTINSSSIGSRTVTLGWSGSFDHVIINAMPSNSNVTVYTNSYTYPNNLSGNVSYTFTITPYNTANTFNDGIPVIASQITTLAIVTNFISLSASINDVFLSWTSGTYNTVTLSWYGPTNGSITGYSGNTFNFGGFLTSSSLYTFSIYGYNSQNIPNQAEIVTISVYTLPIINSVIPSSITYNSITLTLNGFYNAVDLYWNGTDNTNGSFLKLTGVSYTVPSLTPNILYTFTILPYNGKTPTPDVGSQVVITATTYAYISPITWSLVGGINYNNNTVTIQWNNTTSKFKTVSLTWNGLNGATSGTQVGITTSPYILTGLNMNTEYTVTATPYNNAYPSMPGASVTTTSSFITPAIIVSFNISNITSTNMTLTWAGYYTVLNMSWVASNGSFGAIPNISGTTYNFSNTLTTNTIYTFTLTPYNLAGVMGTINTQSASTI